MAKTFQQTHGDIAEGAETLLIAGKIFARRSESSSKTRFILISHAARHMRQPVHEHAPW